MIKQFSTYDSSILKVAVYTCLAFLRWQTLLKL